MHTELLSDIEKFMREAEIGPHRFGILAANNGRLVDRLRSGGRIWPETEQQIRAFMARRRAPSTPTGEEAA